MYGRRLGVIPGMQAALRLVQCGGRILVAIAVFATALVITPVVTATSAHADPIGLALFLVSGGAQCREPALWSDNGAEMSSICIHFDSTGVWTDVYDYDDENIDTYEYIDATIFTQQCTSTDYRSCVTYSAVHDAYYGYNGWYGAAPSKPFDGSHYYRGCASLSNQYTGFSYVYKCTDIYSG